MGYATITAWNSRRHEFLRSSNDHIPRWTPNFRATQHAKRFSRDIAWQPPIASLPEHVSVTLGSRPTISRKLLTESYLRGWAGWQVTVVLAITASPGPIE